MTNFFNRKPQGDAVDIWSRIVDRQPMENILNPSQITTLDRYNYEMSKQCDLHSHIQYSISDDSYAAAQPTIPATVPVGRNE